MARNGSGTMSIINSFSANTTIESSKVNANFTDVASEITGSLPRNGEAGMTGQFKAAAGTSTAPGITFSTDLNLGFYRSAADTMGVAGTLTSDGTTPYDSFPSGTLMLFQQTAAPTGWTKQSTHDDKALRVVTGAASSGGSTAFTSVFTARTIAEANLPVHTHTFSATTSSDGAHTHQLSADRNTNSTGSGGGDRLQDLIDGTAGNDDATTTSNGAHTHTVSGTTGSTGSGTAMDFAVQYVDLIIAAKD